MGWWEEVHELPWGEFPEETAFEAFSVDVDFEVVDSGDLAGLGESVVGLEESWGFYVCISLLSLVCMFGAGLCWFLSF